MVPNLVRHLAMACGLSLPEIQAYRLVVVENREMAERWLLKPDCRMPQLQLGLKLLGTYALSAS
jgi:hypothetical protein